MIAPLGHRLRLGPLAALVALAVLAPPAAAGATARLAQSTGGDVYVAPGGSDEDPGTRDRPFKTIDHALETAAPGQRVLVRGGRYPEMVVASPEGTAGHPITLQPAPGEDVVVTNGFKLIEAQYVRVTGLTFDGAGGEGWGTSIWSSHHIEFSGNEVTGYGSAQGLLVKDRSTHVQIVGNRIHDVGETHRHDHGIYCESATGTLIANNVIYDIPHGHGIHLFGDCDGSRIVNNTISHNGLSGIVVAGNDDRGTADDTLIADNIISHHTSPIGAGEFGFAVTEYKAGRGNVVRDNLFFANAADEDQNCSACAAARNVEGDPRFVDRAAGDFRLRAGSAALSRAGDHGLAEDFAGAARTQGAGPDLGAFERPESVPATASRPARRAIRLAFDGGLHGRLSLHSARRVRVRVAVTTSRGGWRTFARVRTDRRGRFAVRRRPPPGRAVRATARAGGRALRSRTVRVAR